jgi:hypothetical protein
MSCAIALTTSARCRGRWETNPFTALAWQQADVDALEGGITIR